jgi:hypothetical protein
MGSLKLCETQNYAAKPPKGFCLVTCCKRLQKAMLQSGSLNFLLVKPGCKTLRVMLNKLWATERQTAAQPRG